MPPKLPRHRRRHSPLPSPPRPINRNHPHTAHQQHRPLALDSPLEPLLASPPLEGGRLALPRADRRARKMRWRSDPTPSETTHETRLAAPGRARRPPSEDRSRPTSMQLKVTHSKQSTRSSLSDLPPRCEQGNACVAPTGRFSHNRTVGATHASPSLRRVVVASAPWQRTLLWRVGMVNAPLRREGKAFCLPSRGPNSHRVHVGCGLLWRLLFEVPAGRCGLRGKAPPTATRTRPGGALPFLRWWTGFGSTRRGRHPRCG